MGLFKKITGQNHLPGTNDNGLRVYSKQFNELVDDLEKIDDLSNIQPKFVTVGTIYYVDVNSLFTAISGDPFNIELWKAPFIISEFDGSMLNGVYEAGGDFSTEVSYSTIIGLAPSNDETNKEVVIAATHFKPTDGEQLGGIQMTNSIKVGSFNTADFTYRYEENPNATGSEGKYLHIFKLMIGATTILGYVEIYADDTESHQFIFDGIS